MVGTPTSAAGIRAVGGYVDATASAVEHCETAAMEFPEHAERLERIGKHVADKLWHQLTLDVLEFCNDSNVDNPQLLLDLYSKVVLAVSAKLNPLSLARIASAVANALAASDRTAAKALLENLITEQKSGNTVFHLHEESSRTALATIYLQSKHSLLLLQPMLSAATEDEDESMDDSKKTETESIKKILLANASLVDEGSRMSVDQDDLAIVRAAHYEQAMTYYKVVGPPEAFYEQAMSYLNYARHETSSTSSSGGTETNAAHNLQLSVDLTLAALTGDGVYSLARVVQQQERLLSLLRDSPTHAWLLSMLQACASGNVLELQQLAKVHALELQQQPALLHRFTAVQEKTTLLALVALVAGKPSHERTLPFEEISAALHVSLDQVEWVVMRALAVGLVQGRMDQVDAQVEFTWVMPLVLNKAQLADLASKYGEWAVKVSKTKEYMQEQTPTFA